MATSIYVSGPTTISVNIGGTTSILGYTDNDNLPQMTFTDNIHEIKTVASGAAPEEMVVTNTTAVISATLVKWDETVWTSLLARQRGAEGTTTVGRLLINGSGSFGVSIVPTVAGKTSFVFGTCYLTGDAINQSNFGNVERRLGVTFRAIPTPTTNLLYTKGST